MTTDHPLVFPGDDGTVVTTSLVIAEGADIEHASVLRLLRDNLADFEEFGGVRFEIRPFETAGGIQRRDVAVLNEEHATLLLTYMRNSAIVRDFKKRLVRGFWEMRRHPSMAHAALPSKKELAQWVIDAETRAELAEAKVIELTPSAHAWDELAEATGDYSVADAAKVLSRDPAIDTGERRLFQFMSGLRWVFKRDGRWRAYQSQVDLGRLVEKVGKPFWHGGRGEMAASDPTVRITPKGLEELHRRLGGNTAGPATLAVLS